MLIELEAKKDLVNQKFSELKKLLDACGWLIGVGDNYAAIFEKGCHGKPVAVLFDIREDKDDFFPDWKITDGN